MKDPRPVQIHIRKLDPDSDPEGHVMTYDIPYTEGMTVSEALQYLFENLDGTIAFRHVFCKRGSCGLCAVLVDKKPVLACKTRLKGGMLIEPLPSRPPIRDLAVDFCQSRNDPDPGEGGFQS